MEKLIMVIYKTFEIAAHKVRTESDKYRRVKKVLSISQLL